MKATFTIFQICTEFHLLVSNDLSVGLNASSPHRGAGVSWQQLFHHLPLLLLFDEILRNTPPPVLPPGQVLISWNVSCRKKHSNAFRRESKWTVKIRLRLKRRHLRPASGLPLPSSCCTDCASVHDAPDCGAAGESPPPHACRSYSHSCRETGTAYRL